MENNVAVLCHWRGENFAKSNDSIEFIIMPIAHPFATYRIPIEQLLYVHEAGPFVGKKG